MDLTGNYEENRRANRLNWQRTVQIVDPIRQSASVVNVSATGFLLETFTEVNIQIGDHITIEVPHMNRDEVMTLLSRVVRIERKNDRLLLGLDLMS